MIFLQKSVDLQAIILQKKSEGKKIGFIPTMGALHAGHISLIKLAKQKCDFVVCSIFVNPTQFNQASDLATYPRTLESDMKMLLHVQCDLLFHPEVNDLYGSKLEKESSGDYGDFVHVLEGNSRPGHFDGVVTVLRKFFSIVNPHEVFFGQKDYQQCLVVKVLIERSFSNIQFNLCPIAREEDGLAMSSRNVRLTEDERKLAPQIYEALKIIECNWTENDWSYGIKEAENHLKANLLNIEYISVCNEYSLKELIRFEPNAVALIAVKLGNTRLIDNILLRQVSKLGM